MVELSIELYRILAYHFGSFKIDLQRTVESKKKWYFLPISVAYLYDSNHRSSATKISIQLCFKLMYFAFCVFCEKSWQR